MPYEITYETGLRPFVPDTKRGYWAKPYDFIFAGIALVFHLDFFSMSWIISYLFNDSLVQIPTYLLALIVYSIPIMMIQSFLGQFSSSGYISAFRVVPLFKGIGFVSLAINMLTTTYYTIFAAIPLVYLFASLQPTLPWSCSGLKEWTDYLEEEQRITLCDMDTQNVTNKTAEHQNVNYYVPSILYFQKMFDGQLSFKSQVSDFTMAWQLILYSLFFWFLVAVIVYKYFETEKMGQLIRYSVCIFIGLLTLILIRFSFLPGSQDVYSRLFGLERRFILHALLMFPIYGLQALGPGWGIIITLSSLNSFKTDINLFSWIICFAQMFVVTALSLLTHLTDQYLEHITDYRASIHIENVSPLYFLAGSVMVDLELSHFWCITFFFMLFLGALILIVIQVFATLTTIFDEFPSLRDSKRKISIAFIGAAAIISLYFTSNHGITDFAALTAMATVAQSALNLLLIMIVLWIYGRTRFQRDIKFMINKSFSSVHITSLRYFVPIFTMCAMLGALIVSLMHHSVLGPAMLLFSYIFCLLPCVLLPLYAIYSFDKSVGSIKARFLHCCRPNDWYPVDAAERQRYEETMGNTDATHHLNQIHEEL